MATKVVIAPSFYAEVNAHGRVLLDQVGQAVVGDARTIVPYRTGRLYSRISHKVVSARTVRISARTRYAVYVELGTRRMAAQPYLRPALYRVRVGAGGVR